MKRWMHEDDWELNSEDASTNALKELMAANISKQADPEVGIFWYDPESQSLFGIRSADVEDVDFYHSTLFGTDVKTCRPLHYKVWEKEHFRGKDQRFSGNYTQTPRGRVFFVKDKGFVVIVGSWIKQYPEAMDEILFEFNLPDDTEFRRDKHWDIGHGASDKFM